MSRRNFIFVLLLSAALVGAAQAQRNGWPPRGNQGQGQGKQQEDRRGGWGQRGGGQHAGEWLKQHQNQTLPQQEKALQDDPNFKNLPKDRQDRLRERLRKFNSLPPDQRERVLQRMQAWERLSPQQKDRARDMFQRFRALPPDRKQMLNRAFRDLREMSPGERQRALDSPAFRNNFNDSERDILRGMTDMDLDPPHPPGDGGF